MDRQNIKSLFNYLESNSEHLNSLQNKFITSVRENYRNTGVLTQRQLESLHHIKESVPSLAMAESDYGSDQYQAQYSSFDSVIIHCILLH